MKEYKQNLKGIKSWAEEDRPREKLTMKGKAALSDSELLAILIGSGNKKETAVDIAKQILAASENNLIELGKLSVKDLQRFSGIGEAKAITIVAALELGSRRKKSEVSNKTIIKNSKDAFDYLYPLVEGLRHEEFIILLLNRSNRIISHQTISSGGITGTVVDARIIFRIAIDALATAVILCHNHPSGNLRPSDADISLTRKLREAGNLFDINVADHIIIHENQFYSFTDEGIF
ncbi:MAG: DNA repair protein RadC [Bacteroidota bacterium]